MDAAIGTELSLLGFCPWTVSQLAARPSAKTDSKAACELNNLTRIALGWNFYEAQGFGTKLNALRK